MHLQVVHVNQCFGATNCVDCWPYEPLEVYQIVLIVCAFCSVVLGLLGARAYYIYRVDLKIRGVSVLYTFRMNIEIHLLDPLRSHRCIHTAPVDGSDKWVRAYYFYRWV